MLSPRNIQTMNEKSNDSSVKTSLASAKPYFTPKLRRAELAWDATNFYQYTHIVDFIEVSPKLLRALRKYSSLKIFKITRCPPLSQVMQQLLQEDILELLKSCHQMIVLIFEGGFNGHIDEEPLIAKLIEKLRPLVVQIRSVTPNFSSIFFENETFQVETSTESPATHLIEFLEEKLINSYRTLESNFIAKSGSSLDVRISKLLKKETSYDALMQEIKASIESKKFENFGAVLGFPIEGRTNFKVEYERTQLAYFKEIDLLSLALQSGSVEVVEFLVNLKCDLMTNAHVELAWSIKQCECLSVLLKADSPFPNNFDIYSIEIIHELLHQTLQSREMFHQEIARGNLSFVRKFVTDHPKLKYAYDQKNNSAVGKCLASKQLKIYSFLMSKGYSYGVDNSIDEALAKLDESGKYFVRDVNEKSAVAGKDNDHISKLCSMSRLGLNDTQNSFFYFSQIRELFENLNQIPEIATILKVVARTKGLQIIFDFKQKSISHLDPTHAPNAKGSMTINKNIIHIGAEADEQEPLRILGTLAHELAHYAILQVYENLFRPYEKDSDQDFARVCQKSSGIYHKNKSATDQIIKNVFENYRNSEEHCELIVRVPQLLVLHQNDPKRLFAVKEDFSDLFDYFTSKVLIDFEKKLSTLKTRQNQKRKREESVETTLRNMKLEDIEQTLKKIKLEDSNRRLNESRITKTVYSMQPQSVANGNSGKQKCKTVIIERNCLDQEAEKNSLLDHIQSLAESGVLIIVLSTLEMVSNNEEQFLQEISDKVLDKQIILQFNYEDGKAIFYKEENVEFKRLVLHEENIEEYAIVNGIDFEFLCNLLHFGTNFGKFNFNLPETEIAMEKSICGFRLIDWAVKHNNLLCLMFLQLFEPNFESLNESSTRLLEVAAEFGTVRSFEILLNVQESDSLGHMQKQQLSLNSKNSESLLMIAVKSGNSKIVSFLIDCDSNYNFLNTTGETLSDVAWGNYTKSAAETDTKSNNKNLDILIKLLYNDAPFPNKFDKSRIESKVHIVRFEMLICDRRNLHNAILKGQLAQVQSFTENNKLKFAYDVNNQCALTTAIKSKQFEIYSFLCSTGFSGGVDFCFDFHLQLLDENEKEELRKCNLKYFKSNESQHIMDLVSKSRLAFGNDQKHFGKIQKLYESLDAMPEIRPISKIVASSDKTDIVFDFNKSSVEGMDPTGSRFVNTRTYETGIILIGASRENENMLLGTLAHELTHYALQLIFNNNCLPFKWDDESKEYEFEAIAETYENPFYKLKNRIIASALNPNYSLEQKMAELIVRVPHLVAMHRNDPEVLAEIREEFSLLFDFFERKTLPDLKIEEKLTEMRRVIRRTNAKLGVFAKAVQSNWLSDEFFSSIEMDKHIFVQSSVPDLVLESFVKSLQFEENEIDSKNIFVNLEQMFIKKNFEMIKSAAESEALKKIFIIEDSEKPKSEIVEDKWENLFNQCVIVFISKNKKSASRKFFLSADNFNLRWSSLSDESKLRIMKSKVTFQDQEVTLREIVDDELLLQDVPIELLLEPSKLKLKSFFESLPEPPRVFIERFFISCDKTDDESDDENYSKECTTEDICEILRNKKKVLIADLAGMGISTSAAQLARKLKSLNPLSWVVFIDLKEHTKSFVRDCQPRTVSVDAKYFSQKLLKLRDTFEQKLFESFFEIRKVTFVIDGFDEISPNYKQFVMDILKTIQNSENQLLVTTRPHLVGELKEKLDAPVFKLLPFTDEDQIEFLTKYWQHTKNIDEVKVENLLNKFKLTWFSDFYSTPIHIFMLAEIFDDQDLINLDYIGIDVFSLYKRFITMKLKIWMSKGPLALQESLILQENYLNLKQIFHKLALKQIFDANDLEELNLSEIPEDSMNEIISRVGIVSFGADDILQFTHRTFAEYFSADFILKGVNDKNPQKAILNLFFKSLTEDDFEIVRKFMDGGICFFKDQLNVYALSRHFEENKKFFIDYFEERSIFFNIARESHANLMAFVFEKLILDTDVKIEHLKNLLLCAVQNSEIFEVIWRFVENFEKDVQKDFLFARKGDETVLFLAVNYDSDIFNENNNILRHFLECAMKLLNEEEFLRIILGEGHKFRFYNHVLNFDGVLRVIWEAAKLKLGAENLKKLATGKSEEGNTILLSFSDENLEVYDKFFKDLLMWLEDIKSLLNANELSELITAENKSGEVLFTNTVKCIKFEDFQKLWKLIEENINEDDQKKLIFHEDCRKKILIELSIENEDERVCHFIYDITESLLQKNGKDISAYIRERGRLVDFIFNTTLSSPSLLEKITSKQEMDELRTIFLRKTSDGDNFFHRLVAHRNTDDKLKAWNLIIDAQAVKNLLFKMGSSYNQNVFYLAVCCQEDILLDILNWCEEHFSHGVLKNIFFESNGQEGSTLLHKLCDSWRKDFFEKGFAFVEKNFSPDVQDLIFLQEDNKGRTQQIVRKEQNLEHHLAKKLELQQVVIGASSDESHTSQQIEKTISL